MGKKNGLDKAAYILLGLPVLIAAVCSVGTVVGTIWGFITALGDSEGGGWLIFIILLLGIVVVPVFVCWIIQCVTYISGVKLYKKDNMPEARKKGMKVASTSLIGNVIIFFWGLKIMELEAIDIFDLTLTVVPVILILVVCVALILMKTNIRREN